MLQQAVQKGQEPRKELAGFLEQEPEGAFMVMGLLTNEDKQLHVPQEGTQPRRGGLFQIFQKYLLPESGAKGWQSGPFILNREVQGVNNLGFYQPPSFLPPHPIPHNAHNGPQSQTQAEGTPTELLFPPFPVTVLLLDLTCFLPETSHTYTFHSLCFLLPFQSARHKQAALSLPLPF